MSEPTADDPLDMPLPADIEIGHTRFGKGVSLRTFVAVARRWHAMASMKFTKPAWLSMVDWMPMADAPRDEQDVVLLLNYGGSKVLEIGYWQASNDCWWCTDSQCGGHIECDRDEPLGWWPIPQVPT